MRLLAEIAEVLTGRERLRRRIELRVAEQFVDTVRTLVVLVADPVEVVVTTRDRDDDYLVARADASSGRHCRRERDLLERADPQPSVSTPAVFETLLADADGPAESAIGLYKSELVWPKGPWRSFEQLELATLVYVEWFNTRRLHGELRLHTPTEIEQQFYAQPRPETPVTTPTPT